MHQARPANTWIMEYSFTDGDGDHGRWKDDDWHDLKEPSCWCGTMWTAATPFHMAGRQQRWRPVETWQKGRSQAGGATLGACLPEQGEKDGAGRSSESAHQGKGPRLMENH